MLKHTPLFEAHQELGARMVPFAGWEMPVQYRGVMEEHLCVRNAVGLFDISHMGEIFVIGARAQEFIHYITTNDIRRIQDGQCQYAACCYPEGGVVDDVISYQFSPKKYLVVVNASNTDKDYEWFLKYNTFGVDIQNRSPEFCQLALQGPLAEKVLQPLVKNRLAEVAYYHFCETELAGEKVILSRTGYTGEDGFEIYAAWNAAPKLWKALLEAGSPHGIQPIGLAARDTLRLEAAYSLYGHELSESINPLEARLSWIVKLDKTEFIGKKNLQQISKQGLERSIVGIELMEPGVPREGYPVFAGSQAVGAVTSGTFSPTLQKGIALALVAASLQKVGTELTIGVRNKKLRARVVSLPFYTNRAVI